MNNNATFSSYIFIEAFVRFTVNGLHTCDRHSNLLAEDGPHIVLGNALVTARVRTLYPVDPIEMFR
jgi:hypothetical protein